MENEQKNLNIQSEQNMIQTEDDTTFNKLKDLQKLLKKESAVKELFIKMKNETKLSIEHQCIDVYKKKMEVLNILQKIDNSKIKNKKKQTNDFKEYKLIDNNYNYLSNLNTYISNILKYLWEEPKILADLLLKADEKDIKEYLAPLICNNFYENILSPNYIEDPLIYIIYLLLKNEIDNIKDIDKGIDTFLENTPCSYLLGQLIEKNDIKEFFKLILQDTIEDLGTDLFIFSIDDLCNMQRKRGKTISKSVFDKNFLSSKNVDNRGKRLSVDQNNLNDNDLTKVKTLTKIEIEGITEDDKENIKNNINYQIFHAVYLTSIPLKELKENIEKNKDNKYLKNYYEHLLKNANGNNDAYSQTNFIENVIRMEDSESMLVFYQENFLKVKEFLNKFIENLIKNFRIIPYAIKSVCKMINQLVNNKFKDANEIQKSLFISKFFYKTIVFPILKKPDINALINDYIISNNTLNNMNIISDIFWTLVSFKLYKDGDNNINGDFTPFNRVFLEKIEEIFKINQMLIDANLPHFIDGLINKTINEDEYKFDYFNENPDKISFYRSILLNIYDFNALFLNLVKRKDDILQPKKKEKEEKTEQKNTISSKYAELREKTEKNKKLILLAVKMIKSPDNFKILADLLKNPEYIENKTEIKSEGLFSKKKVIIEKQEIMKYFHISELLFSEKSKKIFSLEQKQYYYHVKELKEKDFKNIGIKELLMKNNIIKCKNFLSSILYNYRILEKSDFKKGTTNNMMDILKELEHFMKSSYLIDGSIPSEWYLKSLTECLKKLPDEYISNEYEKLFEELTLELNESIKKCNFEYMSLFLDAMKFGNRNKTYYEKVKEIYMDIELNNKANEIIEKYPINISVFFRLNEKRQEFSIYQEGLREIQLDFLDSFTFDSKNKGKTSKTIDKFTKDFPNFNLYKYNNLEKKDKIGIFEFQKLLDIPKKLMTSFFNYINTQLQNKIKNESELNIINDKIYDYVMSRIYDKIYPKKKNLIDKNIFRKTCQLSWIEPENLIKGNLHYDFDFVLPDINKYVCQIRDEKSPRKKIISLNNIFNSINKLLIFTKGDVPIGVDDQMPLITYCLIKARPYGIFTDLNFMQLYIGNKKNKVEDNELTQLLTILDFIDQAKYSSFDNVSKEEYDEKGEISLKESSEYMSQYDEIRV